MLRGPAGRSAYLAALLTVLLPGPVQAGQAPAGCTRVVPADRPTWVSDAAWTDGGRVLSVVDRSAGRVLRFDPRGAPLEEIHRPGHGPHAVNTPLGIEGTDDGLVVQDDLDRLLWIEDGRVERVVDLEGKGAFLQFLLEPDGVAYFGTWRDETPVQGFLRLGLDPPKLREVLSEVATTAPSATVYGLNRPIFARVGTHFYAVSFDGGPGIRRLSDGSSRLSAFPPGFETAPRFPAGGGPEMIVPLYAAAERARMPVHLLGLENKLYLTTREPLEKGKTRWRLHRIDPAADRLESSVDLPSSAPHLQVVEGSRHWALLEYGRVAAAGSRPLESIAFLPAEALTTAGAATRLACD